MDCRPRKAGIPTLLFQGIPPEVGLLRPFFSKLRLVCFWSVVGVGKRTEATCELWRVKLGFRLTFVGQGQPSANPDRIQLGRSEKTARGIPLEARVQM